MPILDAQRRTQPPPQDIVMADRLHDYCSLKDFKWEIDAGVAGFCFWIYLPKSTPFPATLIRQVHPDATASALLSLDERKRLLLWPLCFVNDELPRSSDTRLGEGQYVFGGVDSPFGRWVHVGYEVSSGFLELHVNGMIVQEKPLLTNPGSGALKKFCLLGAYDNMVDAYICKMEILGSLPIKEQYLKEPPLQLSIDFSCTFDVDEDNEGIWNIVGGKSICRKTFSVSVVLSDALGHPSIKNLEVTAALLYADNGAPVETPFDEEAPLLTSYNGVEFASGDKLIKIHSGHASFKLKISQLSSKCGNRLFRIKFFIPNSGSWPFFEAYSPPIRSISRSRDMLKKASYTVQTNGSQSVGLDNGNSGIPRHGVHETLPSKLAERVTFLGEKPSVPMHHHLVPVRPDEEVNSPSKFGGQVLNSSRTRSNKIRDLDEANISQSISESTGEDTLESKGMSGSGRHFSDACVFKYCLSGSEERANILKELALSASDKDFAELAHQVSKYSGCSHHWSQIAITKRLIDEGTRLWNMMSQHNEPVRWENVGVEVQKQFSKIANTTRSLSEQDLSFLRKVSGCQGYCAHENFEKLWSWLYPVALRLSISWLNSLWSSATPNWIEGFITKEEAELSLQGSRGLQPPGTFVLRFPSSRSWPHPDAGNLVVTYVGSDCTVHHRLLSLDYIHSSVGDKNPKALQNMILNQPELSHLGRVIRS